MSARKQQPARKLSVIVLQREGANFSRTKHNFCTLRLEDTNVIVLVEQFLKVSDFLESARQNGKSFPTCIRLDDLRKKHPVMTKESLLIVAQYIGGRTQFVVDDIPSVLDAANALGVHCLVNEITDQLQNLTKTPAGAIEAVDVAARCLVGTGVTLIFKSAAEQLDEMVNLETFKFINFSAFKQLISAYASTVPDNVSDERYKCMQAVLLQAVKTWSQNNPNCSSRCRTFIESIRCDGSPNSFPEFAKDMMKDCEISASKENTTPSFTREIVVKFPCTELVEEENSDISRAKAGGSRRSSSHSPSTKILKSFRQIELPPVEPNENGERSYKFVVEFDASKEFFVSGGKKKIVLDVEAVIDCPEQPGPRPQ